MADLVTHSALAVLLKASTRGPMTAVFVLGPEKGLAMIERLPGIDVVVIDDQRMMHVSEGLVPPESE